MIGRSIGGQGILKRYTGGEGVMGRSSGEGIMERSSGGQSMMGRKSSGKGIPARRTMGTSTGVSPTKWEKVPDNDPPRSCTARSRRRTYVAQSRTRMYVVFYVLRVPRHVWLDGRDGCSFPLIP